MKHSSGGGGGWRGGLRVGKGKAALLTNAGDEAGFARAEELHLYCVCTKR